MKHVSTVIEINDVDIKLLQGERIKKKDMITFCEIRPVAGCCDEDIVQLLKDMAADLPIPAEGPIVLLPRRFALLRQMRLPSHDHDEIEDMIALQLVNNIPYSPEDVIYRYHVLDRDSEGYSLVLVMIMSREVVGRYQEIIGQAGIGDGKLVLSSFGIAGWLAYRESGSKAISGETAALLNIDSQYSEVCFCCGKRLFFSRNISYQGKHLTFKDETELFRQIKLSLDLYQRERLGPEVRKLWILSSSSEGMALKDHWEKRIAIPVECVGPLEAVACCDHVDQWIFQKDYPFSIAQGLGFLLSDPRDLINFSPQETRAEQQIKGNRPRMLSTVAFSVLAMLLIVSGQIFDIYKGRTELASLESDLGRREPLLKKARETIRFVQFFDEELSSDLFVPDVVDDLNRSTPEGISFRALSVDKDEGLVVQGYAKTHAEINDFQARLIRSSRFYNVDLQFATQRKINSVPVMDFKIAMRLYDDRRVP